ncbi:MAG: HU family DNA-binding protein [Ruminococcus sp.]|nr:HU family DNA-binding protein [Ruminococcus sp.]
MTKAELINAIAEKGGYSSKKDADKALSAVIDVISDALTNGDKVTLVGFGTFEVRERAAKEGINPLTKKPIHIDAKKVPAFKAGKALKDAVNK